MRMLYTVTIEDIRKLGEEVKAFRESKELSQEEMADLLDISRVTYNRKERGDSPFLFFEIYLIAQTYGVRLSTVTPTFA